MGITTQVATTVMTDTLHHDGGSFWLCSVQACHVCSIMSCRVKHHAQGRRLETSACYKVRRRTDECTGELYVDSMGELAEPCIHAVQKQDGKRKMRVGSGHLLQLARSCSIVCTLSFHLHLSACHCHTMLRECLCRVWIAYMQLDWGFWSKCVCVVACLTFKAAGVNLCNICRCQHCV